MPRFCRALAVVGFAASVRMSSSSYALALVDAGCSSWLAASAAVKDCASEFIFAARAAISVSCSARRMLAISGRGAPAPSAFASQRSVSAALPALAAVLARGQQFFLQRARDFGQRGIVGDDLARGFQVEARVVLGRFDQRAALAGARWRDADRWRRDPAGRFVGFLRARQRRALVLQLDLHDEEGAARRGGRQRLGDVDHLLRVFGVAGGERAFGGGQQPVGDAYQAGLRERVRRDRDRARRGTARRHCVPAGLASSPRCRADFGLREQLLEPLLAREHGRGRVRWIPRAA